MGKLDPDDSRPPYRQVEEAIRLEIQSGGLQPGDKLSSISGLAADFGVSVGTVKRALGLLQADGLVVSRQGQGAFVRTGQASGGAAQPDEIAELRQTVAKLAERVEEVERRLTDL